METQEKLKKGFGLFRNYGWKKNLLYILIGFAVCALLDVFTELISSIRVISQFDLTIAIMPLIGFLMGIWGVIGSLLEFISSNLMGMIENGKLVIESFMVPYLIVEFVAVIVNCALPAMLWYAAPLKGETRTTYPKLDTCASVIKYYLIMIATVAAYIIVSALSMPITFVNTSLLDWVVTFTRNLDVVLIAGMPIIIIISVIRRRTININERMVLAFLFIGVIASVIGAFLVYRTTLQTMPELFTDYENLMNADIIDISGSAEKAIVLRYESFWKWYYIIIAVMLNGLLIIEILFMRSIEKKVTKPILHLADVLEDYTDNEDEELNTEKVIEDCRPYRYGYGEVSSLTRTCIDMVKDIETRTINLRSVTAEKERIGTELDVASNIQRDMLPRIFPPFPERSEIDLYASMTPAREVGGDFYDFYLIDHDHLALTIADVSGKGVPASLFMVISKTLLQNHAQMGGTPMEILSYVNHQLCQNNDSYMFCTVWLGILDLTNGHLIAANAGHEYPAIKRRDGSFELLKDKHDPPLGLRDGLPYHEYELDLEPGDILFQYTDGVTEATDAAEELFGEERLTAALNECEDTNVKDTVERIYGSINAFVKDAPQFDDITMLCIRYFGSSQEEDSMANTITVPAKVESLDQVNAFVEERLESVGTDMGRQMEIMLAVEEIFVNIAKYAYRGIEGEATIIFSFDEETKMVQLEFHDKGIPYDPTSRKAPDITLEPNKRPIGGLGIHIVRQTMDEVKYNFLGGENILTIRKNVRFSR